MNFNVHSRRRGAGLANQLSDTYKIVRTYYNLIIIANTSVNYATMTSGRAME